MVTHRQFAEQWVTSTWRPDFRVGVLIRGPDWDYEMPRRRRARGKGKERAKTMAVRRQQADQFYEWIAPIVAGLEAGNLDSPQAMEQVRSSVYASAILIVDTREALIEGITRVLDEGCNCWDDGGQYAWQGNGMFRVHFWYDPSHDHSRMR